MNWKFLFAHHHDDEAERCISIGGMHFCRRCSILYPATLAFLIAQARLDLIPEAEHFYAMVLLPIPVTVIFILEQLGRIPYRPTWVIMGSLLMAPALAVGFLRYFKDPMDLLFWGMVISFATPAFISVLYRHLVINGNPSDP